MVEKISLCIPTYNRLDLLKRSFENVLMDERIGEIVIVDDHSNTSIFQKVHALGDLPKVKVYRNPENLGVYGNKKRAIELATYEWCILFDSDNVIDTDYIDTIYSQTWDEGTILAPSFAKPHFDYRAYAGQKWTKLNIANEIGKAGVDCCLNTMNFFVNRSRFLSVWQQHDNIKGADSIYFNYLWLLAGNAFHVVPKLEYFHLVHDGSYYISVANESAPKSKEIENLLKRMR